MKIYVDLVFFINFFFDFVLLYATKMILKERIKLKRIFLGSLIGSFSIFFLFLPLTSLKLFFLKLMISLLMILTTFGKQNLIKNYIYFYIISIFLGGAMYFLNISFSYKNEGLIFFHNGLSINIIMILILSPLLIYFYVKEHLSYKNRYSNYYFVDIYIGKEKYEFKGYLDTGNTLKDPYHNRSVILINLEKSKLKSMNKKSIYVPYRTITNTGVIPCFKPDKVVIKGKEFKDLLIGDTKNNFQLEDANCILPNIIKEDLICLDS